TSVADYAGSAGRAAAAQTTDLADQAAGLANQAGSVIRTQTNNVLQQQPLAVAVLGLAAGAALAALFPTSAMEERTLGPAHDAAAPGFMLDRAGHGLMTRLALATLAIASVCYVMPATAEEVGVHVGPAPGVVVHGDRDREKTVIEKRGPVEDKTIIKKDHPDGS